MATSTAAQTNKTKKAVRFFCVTLVILFVASIFIWGFQSDWGKVKIKRLTLTGKDGTAISTLIYIPENASDETPAPVVVIMHGRSNHAHSNDTWSMELARRGYVVLSPDLQGGGESDPTVDRSFQAVTVTEYANSLSYVIKDQINLVGYSAGTETCLQVYAAMPEKINSVCEVFGPFMVQAAGGIDNVNTNFCIIKSTADQYDYSFIGDPAACIDAVTEMAGLGVQIEPGTDYDRNGYLFRYSEIGGTMHQTGNISGATIEEIINFVETVSDSPVKLAQDDTQWVPQQFFSAIACVTMMFALAAFINLLMNTQFFGTMAFPRVPRKEQHGGKAWALDILFSFVIPAILFIPVSAYGMAWFAESKILTSTNLNGIMFWLVVVAIIGVIRTIIKAQARKKAGEAVEISDYCLAAKGDKFHWSYAWKALLMGILIVAFFGLSMTAMEGFLGIDYQIWNLSTYLKPSPARIIKAIPYMIIIFAVMFLGNINQRTLPSTGSERKDMWIAVTVNTVLTASALFFLLLAQYGGSMIIGTGQTLIPQMDLGLKGGTSVGALDFAFGYCYMMGGTTGVVTYVYRKHGNVLAAVIPCAIFAGLFTLAGFTLVC